jgi:outer membrane protein assembly factor BamB
MTRSSLIALFLSLVVLPLCRATDPANGWRGNGTGLWPDARPPLSWSRQPLGVLADLRARPGRPDGKAAADAKEAADAPRLEKGLVRDWLVIGPFPVADSVRNFNESQLGDEATVQPLAGDKVGALVWKPLTAALDDRWTFGSPLMPVADLAAAVGGFKINQVAYAHTNLFTAKGGRVRALVEHAHGMKVWLNGKEVYSSSERGSGMGNYYALSRTEFGEWPVSPSPRFDLELKPGWNRLLVKVSTFNKDNQGWTQQSFCLRLMDPPTVPCENKNILWMTELPHRSNATPIVVGERVFVMSEPDELLCLDKRTGKIVWTASTNYYQTLTPEERKANAAFADKIDPLVAALKKEADFVKRLGLRRDLQNTLTGIDAERFTWKADGHFREHFGIVGFSTPTPVSDGKHVWVWCGNNVAACYDMDGKRQWITRVPVNELTYSSSPALADGILACFSQRLVGLDAESGKMRWEQPKIDLNYGSILAARIADVPVFINSVGHVVRARDGKVLYTERNRAGGGSAWGPPVILGNAVHLPRYGVKQILVLDFTGVTGERWEPKRSTIEIPDGKGVGRAPDGRMVSDRPTPGSPLIVGDLLYLVDIYATLYVFDLKAGTYLYHHDTELGGLFHYNAVSVAASPTLIGKHIVIQDNQGLALVLEPGRQFRQVGKNHLGTILERWWPIPAQETTGYSPPVPDGDRLYIRGERYLYCIAEK